MLMLSRGARCIAFWVDLYRERKGKEETDGTDEFRRPRFAQLQHVHGI